AEGVAQAPASSPATRSVPTVAALSSPVVRMSPRFMVMYSAGDKARASTEGPKSLRIAQPPSSRMAISGNATRIEPPNILIVAPRCRYREHLPGSRLETRLYPRPAPAAVRAD